jgi:hypothetical protein
VAARKGTLRRHEENIAAPAQRLVEEFQILAGFAFSDQNANVAANSAKVSPDRESVLAFAQLRVDCGAMRWLRPDISFIR